VTHVTATKIKGRPAPIINATKSYVLEAFDGYIVCGRQQFGHLRDA
jgi:hypothetical protein